MDRELLDDFKDDPGGGVFMPKQVLHSILFMVYLRRRSLVLTCYRRACIMGWLTK